MLNDDNFIFIKGGVFEMGSPTSEVERYDDELQHTVKLDDFYMGKYEVTVKEFNKFIKDENYKTGSDSYNEYNTNDNKPVAVVSWNDATKYCEWLSKENGGNYRLPTEAEWEYACRAGTDTPFNTGDNLTTDQANYDGNYPYDNNPEGEYIEDTTNVGSYPPNKWGLYDMHGNVWEWCGDWYDEDYYKDCKNKGTVNNPIGPDNGSRRVLRGGSWYNYAEDCRSAGRDDNRPSDSSNRFGFRVVFVP